MSPQLKLDNPPKVYPHACFLPVEVLPPCLMFSCLSVFFTVFEVVQHQSALPIRNMMYCTDMYAWKEAMSTKSMFHLWSSFL